MESNYVHNPDSLRPPWKIGLERRIGAKSHGRGYRDVAPRLAKPLAAIFNSSEREGTLPELRKSADAFLLPPPPPHLPRLIESDISPISITPHVPIAVTVLESIMGKWIDVTIIKDKLHEPQFGAVIGNSTTNALIEILHQWYKAIDNVGTFIRVVLLDNSEAFDVVDHKLL